LKPSAENRITLDEAIKLARENYQRFEDLLQREVEDTPTTTLEEEEEDRD
jgi:hypothetical protein